MDDAVGLERTPDGRRIVASRHVDAAPAAAWNLLTDTERWPDWGPSVRAVDCSRRYVRAGTTGKVQTVAGVWLPFEITSCEDDRWTWRVAKIPATGHFVEAEREGCRVGFEIPLLAAGYVPVCQRALERIETTLIEKGDDRE